jgi:hypothetical protein
MKFDKKRLPVSKEKKLEKRHYNIVIGLLISFVTYNFFFDPNLIGHDSRYTIYVFLLPTILGLLILAVYRRNFLINIFTTNKGFKLWTFMTIFYLLQGIVFSYLSLGQVAKISWDILNNKTAKQNVEEVFDCQVTRFWNGKNSSIDFLFNEKHNKFDVQNKIIKDYINKNPDDYYLTITARKGLWNYYLVERWDIKNKKASE